MKSEATKHAHFNFLDLNVDRALGLPVTAMVSEVGLVQKPMEGLPVLPRRSCTWGFDMINEVFLDQRRGNQKRELFNFSTELNMASIYR